MTNESNESHRAVAMRIIKRLKMFNRKERDHLIKFALCERTDEPKISVPLWRLVSGNQGLQRPKDEKRIFIGMDYHLNWLFAALQSSSFEQLETEAEFENSWGLTAKRFDQRKKIKTKKEGKVVEVDKDKTPIQGNQEDVDLLIAWLSSEESSTLCLTLVEAKLDAPWDLKQLKSKMQRFSLIQAASYKMGLGWIDWNCLLLSPEKNHGGNNPDQSAIREEYEKTLTKFCDRSKPMSWRWEPWNGCLPPDGRRHVNRVKGNHTKWEITQKPKDGAA
jgi:hypothetical protein